MMWRDLPMLRFGLLWIVAVGCGQGAASPDSGEGDVPLADGAGEVGETADDAQPEDAPDDVGGEVTADTTVDGVNSDGVVDDACRDNFECVLPCVQGRCDAGQCVFSGGDLLARGCAIAATGGFACVAPGAPDPGRPDCFFCNPAAEIGAFQGEAFAEGFEVGAGRLTIDKLTPSPASWTISTRRAAIGARSLYFGDPQRQTYDVGERAAATASSPPLALPEGGVDLVLSFFLWAETEETPGFDRLRILVVPQDPTTPAREVWTSDLIGGTTRGEFIPLAVELGRVLPGERVAFEADTLDEVINRFEGFYLDALRVYAPCCSGDLDCDDGNACTSETCLEGRCVSTPRPGCCLTDVDCDDGVACTADRCLGDLALGGTCASIPIAGCCEVARDCDDGNLCTEDRCSRDLLDPTRPGQCTNAPLCCERDLDCDDGDPCTVGRCRSGQCGYVFSCCRGDFDCDDGLACTADRCELGLCRHDFTWAPGCCIPDVLTERFDLPLSGWTLTPATNNVGWRLQNSALAQSPPAVLYYGHPTLNFYESGGRNTGSATSPPLRLPDGVELTLSLSIFVDVEMTPGRDLFRVEALLGNGSTVVPLVDKAELTRNLWQEVTVDLSWASGSVVQLRFFFDTVDGAQNTTRGVLVDDVRLLSSCLSRRCGIAAECTSRAACVAGLCEDGECRYASGCP